MKALPLALLFFAAPPVLARRCASPETTMIDGLSFPGELEGEQQLLGGGSRYK